MWEGELMYYFRLLNYSQCPSEYNAYNIWGEIILIICDYKIGIAVNYGVTEKSNSGLHDFVSVVVFKII